MLHTRPTRTTYTALINTFPVRGALFAFAFGAPGVTPYPGYPGYPGFYPGYPGYPGEVAPAHPGPDWVAFCALAAPPNCI
jgi:hypothetical protein